MNKNDTQLMNQSWRQMRAILDKEMPTDGVHRNRFFWWLTACILICLLFSTICLRQMSVSGAMPENVALTIDQHTNSKPEVVHPDTWKWSGEKINAVVGQNKSKQVVAKPERYTNSSATLNPGTMPVHPFTLTSAESLKQIDHVSLSSSTVSTVEDLLTPQVVSGESAERNQTTELSSSIQAPSELLSTFQSAAVLPLQLVKNLNSRELPVNKAKPYTKARKPLSVGLGVGLGSSLLPVPSSGQLTADVNYQLHGGYELNAIAGLQSLVYGKSETVLVDVPEQLLDDANASPDVIHHLASNAELGQYPSLKSALYYQLGLGMSKRFLGSWIGGVSARYFRLTNATLGSSGLMRNSNAANPSLDQAFQVDVQQTLDALGTRALNKNALAIQTQLSREIGSSFRISCGLRTIVSKGHPEPMSIQLGALYTPFRF